MLDKIRDMDRKLLLYISLVVVGVIVLFIVVSNVIELIINNKSVSGIEKTMVKATKKYVLNDESVLPGNLYDTITIEDTTLVSGGYMKSISEINKKLSDCSGKSYITKIGDNNYNYSSEVTCNNSKFIKDEVIKNIVTTGDGLYNENDMYVFKGENVNNYVKIGDYAYRIVNISNSGIKVIANFKTDSVVWDDRFNSETGYESGITNYNVSRVKDTLINLYNSYKYVDTKYLDNIVNTTWCIGSRSVSDLGKNNEVECNSLSDSYPFGLLTASEVMNASLDTNCLTADTKSCMNYNYLTAFTSSYWTLTPVAGSKKPKVYYVGSSLETANPASTKKPRIAIVLRSDSHYTTGDGTESNPYILK